MWKVHATVKSTQIQLFQKPDSGQTQHTRSLDAGQLWPAFTGVFPLHEAATAGVPGFSLVCLSLGSARRESLCPLPLRETMTSLYFVCCSCKVPLIFAGLSSSVLLLPLSC